MIKIQKPVVAGSFYPKDVSELNGTLENFFAKAKGKDKPLPKAIIAPHAGYVFSGQIAASAFSCLSNGGSKIKRVVIMAPAHRYPFPGLAISSVDAFSTPLGEIMVDKLSLHKISNLPKVSLIDQVFWQEHALEVELPFLQKQLKEFALVPILVGDANPEEVAEVLNMVWGGDETLIVVSSDLSHYFDYQTAKTLDAKTIQNILELNYRSLTSEKACGYIPLQGLLKVAFEKKLKVELIDSANSGDSEAGTKDHVVGYGAFHLGTSYE